MEQQNLNPSTPPSLHLISAFLSMEPTDCLISFSKECGRGSITDAVQTFILDHCLNPLIRRNNAPSDLYVKNFLKKVIVEVESSGGEVLDGLYEKFAYYITSLKEDGLVKDNARVCKTISFLFPEGYSDLPSCPKSMKFEVPLRCSLNMLEGDTGCSIWPSSLFLSEFILSYPELFSTKSCFEVGSGVGLVGISLSFVKASKVILSDGDMSTLANLKLNLELSQLNVDTKMTHQTPTSVECKYLPWETSSEAELQCFQPHIVLGADVIYDPLCLPHLIRVLLVLLNPNKLSPCQSKEACRRQNGFLAGADDKLILDQRKEACKGQNGSTDESLGGTFDESLGGTVNEEPVAYLATVVRNVDTFNYFLELACQAHLRVVEITAQKKPLDLLPYMRSYDRSSIQLFTVKYLCD